MKYYAVVCGVQPGIYTDWPSAEKMVKGFPGAIFKSFRTRIEAEAFIKDQSKLCPPNPAQTAQQPIQQPMQQPMQQPTQQPIQQPMHQRVPNTTTVQAPLPLVDHTTIYTDGSMQDKTCGFGVVIITNTGDKFEAYGRVPQNLGVTNNVAELYAIYVGLSLVKGNVMVYSDSKYAIGVLTGWNAVANVALIDAIRELIQDRSVRFQHVYSHTGIEFNEEADKLADLGREQLEPLIVIKNGNRLPL